MRLPPEADDETPPLVDTICEDPRWEAAGLPALADVSTRAVLHHLGLPDVGLTLALLGCDDARIAALNADFRGKPQPTNVLSWPAEDLAPKTAGSLPRAPERGEAADPVHLGDIALAFDTCVDEAKAQGKPLTAHACHLVVHGVLHLLGYDHETDADAELMESSETAILASLGLADPYALPHLAAQEAASAGDDLSGDRAPQARRPGTGDDGQ